MATHHLGDATWDTAFSADLPPALVIDPGDTVVVDTRDCFNGRITRPDQVFATDADLVEHTGPLNPVTGPIVVRGADVGDVLVVRVDALEVGRLSSSAVTVVTGDAAPYGGCDDGIAVTPHTRIAEIREGRVVLDTAAGRILVPARPMVGAIGVAGDRPLASLGFSGCHGGNVDCPDLTVGATIVLPVRVAGGWLWIGDVHAAMGDAEITGTAFETSGRVTVTVGVRPQAKRTGWIELDDRDSIGVLGAGWADSVTANVHRGFAGLHRRLTGQYGLNDDDAHVLLGVAARVRINQCVQGVWTATRVSLARTALPRERRDDGV